MGYFRLALSLIIMISHLVYRGNEWGGASLILFYALSGYAITARGTGGDFWRGRLMRLWPSYAAIAAMTQVALWFGWVPGRPYIALAYSWAAVPQLLMIVPTWPEPALVPAAWMLKWILLGYVLVWLGASRTPQRSAVWLLASLVASVWWMSRTQSYGHWYISVLAASLATSAGACAYHLGLSFPRDQRWAAIAGTLSYPVFLAHYGVGAAVAGAMEWGVGWPLFWASLTPTLALSWVLVVLVEQPVLQYRTRETHRN
jgi:peptidoglycan/LPS O-acetylase OafA/YrhL